MQCSLKRSVDMTGLERPGDAAGIVPISIVSSSRLFREGLARLLAPFTTIRVIGDYAGNSSGRNFERKPEGLIVLLDAGIGLQLITEWTQTLRESSPAAQILVLELADDYEPILACIEAGANGYLLQGASGLDVVKAIHEVSEQRARCSPDVTARLFQRLAASRTISIQPSAKSELLTPRELEVLQCVALDWTNQQIANHLVVDLSTVKHHVHNILEKLQLRHRWAAVRLAQQRGWLSGLEHASTGS